MGKGVDVGVVDLHFDTGRGEAELDKSVAWVGTYRYASNGGQYSPSVNSDRVRVGCGDYPVIIRIIALYEAACKRDRFGFEYGAAGGNCNIHMFVLTKEGFEDNRRFYGKDT